MKKFIATFALKATVYSFFFMSVCLVPASAQETPPQVQTNTFFKGKVLSVIDDTEVEEYGMNIRRQTLHVQIKNGEEKGREVTVIHEVIHQNGPLRVYEAGDLIVGGQNEIAGEITYYISDTYRLHRLWWIVATFMVLITIFGRSHGIRAFVGLGITFIIIGYFIIPQILEGANPLLINVIGLIVIACVSLYVAHGITARTSIAFMSTLVTMLLAFGIAYMCVKTLSLLGVGTEEAFYLQFAPIAGVDLRGLLLGGILLGALGVLDDITTAQAAAVEEISRADTKLGFNELYQRGLSVGREHIVSLVNTLALAYTGASFPLLLLFVIYERPLWVTLNSEIILEEVVRTLVGSIGLVLAVPITTLLAAHYYAKHRM